MNIWRIANHEVFYEKNRATLNQGSIRYMEALIELLRRYPEMEIEVYVHTDTRGNAEQNLRLTKEQADNIQSYLEYREREYKLPEEEKYSKRTKVIGKGDMEPRNHCKKNVDCSDEEHRQNNRLEIKVIKLGTIQRP